MKLKLLFAAIAVISFSSRAQIAIPSAAAVTQNFDGIGNTAPSNLPANWKMTAAGATTPTWAAGTNVTTANLATEGMTLTTGGRYNWGNGTTPADRAIGFMTSGSYASPNSIMAHYQNTSGVQINDLTIAFDYERYRINVANASITFFTSTDGTTWTPRTAGDSGAFSTGASQYTFPAGTIVNRTVTLTGINIPNNGNFYLRWNFDTVGSNSQGLGLDNVSLTATLSPTFVTTTNGAWSNGATWLGGIAPGPGDNATVNHAVVVNSAVVRNAGTQTTVNASGTLTISTSYVNNGTTTVDGTFVLANGVTINAGSTFRVNGNCVMGAGGFFTVGSPVYSNTSTLTYSTGAVYGRGLEWIALGVGTIGVTPGYPNNVTLITTGTALNYNNGTPDAKAMYGNLNIGTGTSFFMDYGGGASNGTLTVGGNISTGGTLTLGNANGDDLVLYGNYLATAGATFNGNGRAIIFSKASGTQSVTAPSGITIPYVVFNAIGNRTVQLVSTVTISAPNTGNAVAFGSAADILDLNGNTLTIGTAGVSNVIAGAGSFKGSATSALTLLGTGNIGTLNFTTGFQNLGTFTINRTSGALAATLGTPLTINTNLSLTNGLLDVGNNPLTIESAATMTGPFGTNYIIADRGYGANAALRKVFTTGGVINFDFPIGDRAASADGTQYSPARLVNLTGGTYAAGAYVSVAVNDIKHPNLDAATDFISRYWDVQTSGISAPTTFSVSAVYTNIDINGTEANSRANRWTGSAWATPGSLVSAATNTVTAMTGFVAGGTNHFTAGLRDQEINVIHTATTTNYLHNSTYDFGSVLVGSNLDVQFTVQNIGQAVLSLPGVNAITGGPAYAYSPTGTLTTGNLAGPAGTRNFTIRFAPSGAGTFTGSITIPNDDPTGAEAPYVINFTGIGVVPAPEIRVERSDNGNIPNASAASNGYFTIYAAQDIGTSSAARVFYVRNEGTATLNVASITSNSADFVVNAVTPATIAPAGFLSFTVTFTPTAIGVRNGVISVASNDADENPFTFGVQGTGQCALSTFSLTPASGPEQTVVTINSPSFNLTGVTASFNGTPASVTVISASSATVTVPVGAVSGSLVLTNPVGCQSTSPFTVIDNITTACQGGNTASELFISEVTDATTGGVSYVEIYNATANPINMSGYSLYVYSNGSTGTPVPSITPLNNFVLNPQQVYLVALGVTSSPNSTNTCSITGGNGELANQTATTQGINFDPTDNDYIGLYKNSISAMVDSFGVYGNDTWADVLGLGDRGATFRRKNNVTVPSVAYSNSDWDITDWAGSGQASCSTNDYSDVGTFNFISGTPPTVTIQPVFTPSCKNTTFTVTATEGFPGGLALAYQWYEVAPNTTNWTQLSDGGLYSGTSTATLAISNISALVGYQYYVQVRENGTTCYTASNAVMIGGATVVTWNGTAWAPSTPTATTPAIIDGNYNTATNGSFEACSLTVLGTRTLTISNGDYVSVINDLTVNATGSLLVLNNGSLVMVEDSGIVTNNGTMQVSRTTAPFVKYDYTYWSSPVVSANLGASFPGWRTDYSWTFNTANYSDVTGPGGTGPADGFDDDLNTWTFAGPAATLIPAKGYVIMGPTNLASYPATSTVTFSGAVNNGVITIPLAMSANPAATDDDFNIIGNPYPSSVFADDFINLNTNTSGTVKFWTHQAPVSNTNPGPYQSNFVTSDYAMYNLSGGTASGTGSSIPTGMIATGQGFLVEALTGTNVVFNNSMRDKSQNNSNFYRSGQAGAAPQKDRVWLNFTHQIGLFSQQLVAYIDGATLDHDRGYDGIASKSGNTVSFYSFIGAEKYRIQGRPSFSTDDVVPMGYSTGLPGTYTIGIDHAEGQLDDPSVNIYIEDKLLQIIHDLKESDYVFTTELGTFNDRFQLRYTDAALGNPDVSADDQVGVISSNQVLEVKARTEIASVEVYDMLGRNIFSSHDVNNTDFSASLAIAKQAILVKVILKNGYSVSKKIVH